MERERINVKLSKGTIPMYTKIPEQTVTELREIKEMSNMPITKIIPVAIHYLHAHKDDIAFIIN